MIIYFGGIFNGKLETVLKDTNIDVYFDIKKDNINDLLNFKIINDLDAVIRELMMCDIDPLTYIKKLDLKDKIIIFNINGNGVVPIEKFEREFRDNCGNVYKYLIANAKEVYKIIYGLKERLKWRIISKLMI